MIAIIETNKLHIDQIYNQYQIDSYSVDSTLSAVFFQDTAPPYTVEILTIKEYEQLKQTPAWNHSLLQGNN